MANRDRMATDLLPRVPLHNSRGIVDALVPKHSHTGGMSIVGTVRAWHDEDGWGVIESAGTPGGCWAHLSTVAAAGYRALAAGQPVDFEYEPADQDGFAFRAVRVWPHGAEPQPLSAAQPSPSTAYRSSLTITYDDPDDRGAVSGRGG